MNTVCWQGCKVKETFIYCWQEWKMVSLENLLVYIYKTCIFIHIYNLCVCLCVCVYIYIYMNVCIYTPTICFNDPTPRNLP